MRQEPRQSLSVCFAAALRQESVQCAFGLSGQQTVRYLLCAIYHFIDRSYPQLAAIQLDNDVATPFQANRLAEVGWDAKTPGV
jgi:hypothetical protein